MTPLLNYDRTLHVHTDYLIGVDEAGRGPLAGPVVAAAVCLGKTFFSQADTLPSVSEFNDSKKIKESQRETLFAALNDWRELGLLSIGVGIADVEAIDTLNILGATAQAMADALRALEPLPESHQILIDGRPHKKFPYTHTGLVRGDGTSLAIAMSSIIAKVTRDRIMCTLDKEYPYYGFAQHKGYGTEQHRNALLHHGASPAHRRLFLRKVLGT